MKKKLLVLLSSVVAGVGLVGATFASWAVTDNADPLGIQISPSAISQDKYDTLVLEWGDTTEFTNISSLGLGVANAQYVHLQVKATSSNGAQGGNLSVALEDRTVDTERTTERLVEHLVVEVYKTYANESYSDKIADLTIDGKVKPAALSKNKDIETPANGAVQDLYFKVYIDAEGLDAAKYAEMKSDVNFLTVNWDKPSEMVVEEGTIVPIYYYYAGSEIPHVYAWNSTTLVPNHDYPGVAMTPVEGRDHYFTYALKTSSFDRIIINKGAQGDENKLTGDVTVPSGVASNPYYNGTEWTTLPDLGNTTYWLIGTMNKWTTQTEGYQFVEDSKVAGKYTLQVTTTEANSVMKVIASNGSEYWGETTYGGSEDTQVFTLGQIGTYTLTFYPNGNNNVYLSAAAAE